MAQAGTLHDAFIDELRDTYDAEKQLIKALPKLAKAAASTDLRAALNRTSRKPGATWNASSRSSRASKRSLAASIARVLRASSKKASR